MQAPFFLRILVWKQSNALHNARFKEHFTSQYWNHLMCDSFATAASFVGVVASAPAPQRSQGVHRRAWRGRSRRYIGAMTPDDFRRIALSMPQATEVYRRGHSEFRVERRTFASLGGPADTVATLNLTPEQQSVFMHATPAAFVSVAGGWGRLGRTNVLLASAEKPFVDLSVLELGQLGVETVNVVFGRHLSAKTRDVVFGRHPCLVMSSATAAKPRSIFPSR
jgi:hypothetical protein